MNLVKRTPLLCLTLLSTPFLTSTHQASSGSAELERLKGNLGGEVILASIEAIGGWGTWSAKTDVQYERDVTRYEEDSRVIREKQFHRFVMPPAVRVRLETVRDGKHIVTGFDGTHAWVTEDGKAVNDTERLRGARRLAFGTQYMFCLPFKLTDAGACYEHLGTVTLGKKIYDKVRVAYAPGTGDNPEHIWTFYFDQKTHFLERIDWTDGKSYSITEYKNYQQVDGLWLPTARSNYHADAQGNKKRKFSDLVYRNIRFNNNFDPKLVASPP